jgi:hypothetical protein
MENIEDIIFLATCKNSVTIIKTFVDIMYNISSMDSSGQKLVKQIYIKITNDGLYFSSCNTENIKGNIFLSKDFFEKYELNQEGELCIGISLDIIKTCFKNILKNDSMEIMIKTEEFNNFPDRINVVLNQVKGFSIKFNIIQNTLFEKYDGFIEICEINVKSIPNIFRELGGSKKIVEVSTEDNKLKLQSSLVDIAESWITFPLKNQVELPKLLLRCEIFKLITKLGLLDENIIISYSFDKQCFLFSCNNKIRHENFGNINIFIIPIIQK